MSAAELNVRLLLAVAVIIVAVQVVGWLLARLGQPRVIGEVLAGILLGPSLLGIVAPDVLHYLFPDQVIGGLRMLAQFGLALFMLLVGLHLDIPSVRGNRKAVAAVAPASILVPFGLAVALGAIVYPEFGGDVDPVVFCLFLGCAMAVTALPVLARLIVERGLAEHRLGGIAMACAAVNDVVAWCLVGLVAALAGAGAPGGMVVTIGLAVAFVAGMLLVVRPLLARVPDLPIWAVLVIAIGSAWLGELIGIHAIIGAFLAGVAMPRRAAWMRTTEDRLDVAVRTLLLPVFFVVAGLGTRVDQLTWPAVILTIAVIVVATAGKLGAATLAARLSGEDWRDALTLGALMNTRGVTELAILSLGLQLGVISSTVYTVMVLMALITTLATAPLLTLLRKERTVTPAVAVQPQT